MSSLFGIIRKIVTYSTISLAGIIMLYKLFTPSKGIDKKFMSESKKNGIKKLRYLFYNVKNSNVDNLVLTKVQTDNSKNSDQLGKIQKISKMETYLQNVFKMESNETTESARDSTKETQARENSSSGSEMEKEKQNPRRLIMDKRDKVFYQLFQNVSRLYVKTTD